MAVMPVMPRAGDWTVDDLDRLPDDGLRYELVDGVLLVTPAPLPSHQLAVIELAFLLRTAQSSDVQTFVAPLDFRPNNRRSFQPDVLVVRREDVGERNISRPLLLAVEVLSPGTRSVDLLLKPGVYQEGGVVSYWLVDPDQPSVTVLELDGAGRYQQVGFASGEQVLRVQRPFPVELIPARLVDP
jgi:Uma2 family endonuclease